MRQVSAQVDEGLPLHPRGGRRPEYVREDLASRLNAALSPSSLLSKEGAQRPGKLRNHPDVLQVCKPPTLQLGAVADVQVLGEGIELPTPGFLQSGPAPHARRAVEVEEAPTPEAPPLFEGEVSVQEDCLSPGKPPVVFVQVVPSSLDHPHSRILKGR